MLAMFSGDKEEESLLRSASGRRQNCRTENLKRKPHRKVKKLKSYLTLILE